MLKLRRNPFKTRESDVLSDSGLGRALDDTEVLIASPKEIAAEYRCFCTCEYGKYDEGPEFKVLTCSRYMHNGQICLDWEGCPDAAEFALNAMNRTEYGPGEIFVMDVARLYDNTFCIVELNHAQTSAFYKTDVKAIVKEIIEEYDTNP